MMGARKNQMEDAKLGGNWHVTCDRNHTCDLITHRFYFPQTL